MNSLSDSIKNYAGQNPFGDIKSSNFSDKKIAEEFCPTSTFWSLFSDQHEILLGRRGSGKTYLLKMMRTSMLLKMEDLEAKRILADKRFFSLYVPMRLQFVAALSAPSLSEEEQIARFKFAFNCLLADALISELLGILEAEPDKYLRATMDVSLAQELYKTWFGGKSDTISDLFSLSQEIKRVYHFFDLVKGDLDSVPLSFRNHLFTTLILVTKIVERALGFTEEPSWIICIDEAEFLNKSMLKCFNNVIRSDNHRMILKIATLPFHYTTYETLIKNVVASPENDFKVRVIDMKYDDSDFIKLTNDICMRRFRNIDQKAITVSRLEDVVGCIGNDDQIDYFREEIGKPLSLEEIQEEIIKNFSSRRQHAAPNYNYKRKTIFDKYAPIYYTREMYQRSLPGNSIPGWYAGSPMIRKLSQGNPRAFIQIMSALFEDARQYVSTPKRQHQVLLDYSTRFCKATLGIIVYGPTIYKNITKTCHILHKKVHGGALTSTGMSFIFTYETDDEFQKSKDWIHMAIAHARLLVDEQVLVEGISPSTRYLVSFPFAAVHWLPMRNEIPIKIKTQENEIIPYKVIVGISPEDQRTIVN